MFAVLAANDDGDLVLIGTYRSEDNALRRASVLEDKHKDWTFNVFPIVPDSPRMIAAGLTRQR